MQILKSSGIKSSGYLDNASNGTVGSMTFSTVAWNGVTDSKGTVIGNVTAGAPKSIVQYTGSGICSFVGVQKASAVAQYFQVQIKVDGVVIYTVTTETTTNTGGIVPHGTYLNNGGLWGESINPIVYKNSFEILVASDVTGNLLTSKVWTKIIKGQ